MGLWWGIQGRRLRLAPVGYRERRGSHVLLVWGELPYWMVVDDEMEAFLGRLDGQSTLGEVLQRDPASRQQRRMLLGEIRQLLKHGVVADSDSSPAPPSVEPLRIENVAINLTRRCNLRCRFCYNLQWLANEPEGELSAEEFNAFLDDIRPFCAKSPSLVVLGGEPLLEEQKLLAVARRASGMGFVPIVSTNGTHVTADLARRAADARLQVQVSLDGHDAPTHDAVRGHGVFEKAIGGIRRLVEHGVYTILSMVCHQGNLPHLGEFYALSHRLGVREARFIPLKRMGGASDSGHQPAPMREMLAAATALFAEHPEYLRLAGRDAFSILGNTCRYSAKRTSCGTGSQTLLLDADGSIYPCLNTNRPEFRAANVRDAGYRFEQVWRASPTLRHIRQCTSLDAPGRACAKCVVRHWCLGGCGGETLVVTGDLKAASPQCADLRRAVLDMMWVLAEKPELVKEAIRIC